MPDIRDILLNGDFDPFHKEKETEENHEKTLEEHIKVAEILEALAEEDTVPLEIIKAAHAMEVLKALQEGLDNGRNK